MLLRIHIVSIPITLYAMYVFLIYLQICLLPCLLLVILHDLNLSGYCTAAINVLQEMLYADSERCIGIALWLQELKHII